MISNPRRGRAPISSWPFGREVHRATTGVRRATPPSRPRPSRIRPAWWRALGQPAAALAAHNAEHHLQIAPVEAALDDASNRADPVLADLRRGRAPSSADDQGLLLLAFALNGRGAEAEACARQLVVRTGALAPGHLQGVLDAWAYRGCPEGVERAYREFAPLVRADTRAEARIGLVRALGLAGDPRRARRWHAVFADPSAQAFAALVAAHGHRGEIVRLHRLWIGAQPRWRRDREVAEAFVFSFAAAGDPEAAERCLRYALALVEEADARDAMCIAAAGSYLSAGRGADARRVMAMSQPGFVTLVEGR